MADKPFVSPTRMAISTQWMNNLAHNLDTDFQTLIDGGKEFIDNNGGFCMVHPEDGGRWEGESLPEEYWYHFQIITGQRCDPSKRWSFLSCSC